jgi:hypothetical protein
MKVVFNPIYLYGNRPLFFGFLIVMEIIMILTLIFIIRELKKNDSK